MVHTVGTSAIAAQPDRASGPRGQRRDSPSGQALPAPASPLRIAYLVHLNLGPQTGVFRKIASQTAQWARHGHRVRLFVVTRTAEVVVGMQSAAIGVPCSIYPYGRRGGAAMPDGRLRALGQAAAEVLQWGPQIVYTRQDFCYVPVVRLARRTRLVIEINTHDLAEIAGHSRGQWLYHLLTRGFLLRSAAGLVFVCSELAGLPHFRRFRRPYTVIGNGIDLGPIQPAPAPSGGRPRLVFVGQRGCPWHGVDKVALLARAQPDWEFRLVGPAPEDLGTPVPANVVLYGSLDGAPCRELLRACDCAVGTLALHRNRMHEASPLKTREYLAYGLPVIIGYQDTDFPRGADFLLQVPNTETGLSEALPGIRRFVAAWKGRRVPREAIRHLGSDVKERRRVAFFRFLLAGPA
ncbi:MAG: glycosyltransferase family 4 protein [Thermoguttaceae bacterium]